MNADAVGHLPAISKEGQKMWGCPHPKCGYRYARTMWEGNGILLVRCYECERDYILLDDELAISLDTFSMRGKVPAHIRLDSRPEEVLGEFIHFDIHGFRDGRYYRECFVCGMPLTTYYVSAVTVCKAAAERVMRMIGHSAVNVDHWEDWLPATVSIGVCSDHVENMKLLWRLCKTSVEKPEWKVITVTEIEEAIGGKE